jgi:hypothetical protein
LQVGELDHQEDSLLERVFDRAGGRQQLVEALLDELGTSSG